jgi:hypothetical protein
VTSIGSWIGTGAGVILIGACFIAAMFTSHLPSFSHPWVHRALIVGMYAGATALIVTTIGQFFLHLAEHVAGFFGGFGSGLGKAAIILAAFFLLLTVLIALIKVPSAGAGVLAVALAFLLALVPGGFLHQFYAETAIPGQQIAAQFAAWLGG